MGQTLTNGIYLPNEGERNCYSGLAANWNAVDTLKGNYSLHAINVDIHVTAAEKEAWNGKADASALTAHTGDTTIHVTAEDKATWNGKANDTDVMHLTGNERSSGNKTFAGEIISNSSILISNGSDFVTGTKDQRLTDKNNFNILNERITYNTSRNVRYTWTIYNKDANGNLISSGVQLAINPNGQAYFYPINDNDILFGAPTAYIKGIYTKLINSINPSALSIPASSGSVDISAYITDFSGGNNTYTPPVNGFVYVDLQNADNLTLATGGLSKRHHLANSTFTRIADYIHVRANAQVVIICSGTLKAAAFIPCQGNI